MISSTRATTEIVNRINQRAKDVTGSSQDVLTDTSFLQIMTEEIIKEITTNGQVSFTNVSTVLSPSGPCTGGLIGGNLS